MKINFKNNKLFNSVLCGFLLLLPCMAAFADGGDSGGNGVNSFDPTTWTALIMQNLDYVADILQSVQVIIGLMLLGTGINGLVKHGHTRGSMTQQGSLASPITRFFCGVALLTSFTWINTVLYAFFGDASPESNPFANSSDALSQLYEPAMMIIQCIGIGAFMKAVLIFSRSGSAQHQQPGMIGKGFVFAASSIMCIHIKTTMLLVLSFFGFSNPF